MTRLLTSEVSRAVLSMLVICLPMKSLPQILLVKIPLREGYSKILLILLSWGKKKIITRGVEMSSHRIGLLEHHPCSFPRLRYRHTVLDINISK